MHYFVVGDEDTVLGLGLVGVPGRVVGDADEARAAFHDAIQDGEAGIVIITERVADSIRELVDSYLLTEDFPLILEVPDRSGHDESRPGLREVVNQAIGISV